MVFLVKLIVLLAVFIVLAIASCIWNSLNWVQGKTNVDNSGEGNIHRNNSSNKSLLTNNSFQEIDSEKYIRQVVELVELFGFKFTGFGEISLKYREIDRSHYDMALSTVLAAIADDYFTSRIMIKEISANIFVIGMVKNLMESGVIDQSVFKLAIDIVNKASDENIGDYDSMLEEFRGNNYLVSTDRSTLLCYPDFKNNKNFKVAQEMFMKHYNEYKALQN